MQLVLVFINFDLFDIREIVIYLVWIPFLTIPNIFFKKKWINYLTISFLFFEGFVNLIHIILIKGPISVTSIFILTNTNISEVTEFMDLKFNVYFFLVIPYLFIYFIALKKTVLNPDKINKWVLILVLLFSNLFIVENLGNQRLVRKGVPQLFKVLITYYHEVKSYHLIEDRDVMEVACENNSKEKRIFVLIIGESGNRNHMSLYGYKRNTNPKLGNRNDILVYDNVVSSHSNTIHSVLTMLSEMNLENKKKIDESITLIDVFHSANYKTHWISNQPPLGVWDSPVAHIAQTADVVRFLNTNSSTSFEATYISSYDEKLFTPFIKALNDGDENKFIILHLMGNHSAYAKRYPAEFNKFSSHTTSENKVINEYDNSMLYNDFVVDSLLEILHQFSLKHKEYKAASIYLADHGENVYDENNNVGHDYAGSVPKSNVEVPFILWLSKNFDENNPNFIHYLAQNKNLPFVTDDLFHAIIDLNNIDCECYEKTRSLFHQNYNSQRKRILEDNQDYDLK